MPCIMDHASHSLGQLPHVVPTPRLAEAPTRVPQSVKPVAMARCEETISGGLRRHSSIELEQVAASAVEFSAVSALSWLKQARR